MNNQPTTPAASRGNGSALLTILAIGAIVGLLAMAFAWTAGWLSPNRVTPARVVDKMAPPKGPVPGYRRNHAKGICFSGTFEANGVGTELSKAQVLAKGSYPVTGRFNLAGPNPAMPDGTGRVRGMGVRVQAPDRQEWRMAMITAPFFSASTVKDFTDSQTVSAKKDPEATKQFAASHPAMVAFGAWAKSAPYTESFVQDRFNSINSFTFTNAAGRDQVVRWSFVPVATPVAIEPADLKNIDPDFLEKDIVERVAIGPQRWKLVVTLANPGDVTADPSKVWPEDRRKVEVGSLAVSKVEPESDGPCRDLNFDPTVLPSGMTTSDDPFPAARSAAYAVSYNRRTAEEKQYPRSNSTVSAGANP